LDLKLTPRRTLSASSRFRKSSFSTVTPTPQVADYVEGVANLRGAIIPIINLRKLFGLAPRPADAETRTIVVNVGGRTMGCTVDMVSQVLRIPDEAIQDVPESVTAGGADYLAGFAKVDERLVILLDIDELLSSEKLSRARAQSEARSARPQSAPTEPTGTP
jgi:purine-binding chemotaxis protein CheW